MEDDGPTDDAARFTRLYERYYGKVLGYALAHHERGLAEDVVHETFLTAWRKLDAVPLDDALPWLLAAARNHRLKQYAAGRRRDSLTERISLLTSEQDLIDWDTAERVVERDAALSALTTLAEQDAEVLILTSWYGFTPRQAAQVMACSTATLFVRLHRARKRLKAALEKGSEKPDAGVRPGDVLEGQYR